MSFRYRAKSFYSWCPVFALGTAILCALCSVVTANLHFAFFNGTLYADLSLEIEDRGTTSLYGLVQLSSQYKVDDIYGKVQKL
jgi:hypothetical protein